MKEQNELRIDYVTWDEAFRGLAPVVRQQSVRIAAYTQALYVEACASGFGAQTPAGAERMQATYADLAYKCGMYHQLGKALVPEEYQILQNGFTDEEHKLYRKYTTDGRRLVAQLQEKTSGGRRRGSAAQGEFPTENIPWLMLRESCQQHMERYDGTGYPEGRAGDAISPIAQIVGMAKMFDHLSAEMKSENPLTEAVDAILAESGKAFSPELCQVFRACRQKIQGIYTKFIHYTMRIPRTIPLVTKSKDRPMGLTYRPAVSGDRVVSYEAIPWFAGKDGELEDAATVAPRLARTELTVDVSFYLLYEAADTLLRIQNCALDLPYLLVHTIPGFFGRDSHLKRFEDLFADQPVDRTRLLLTIPEKTVLEANKSTAEVIRRYLRNGVTLLLDDYHPESLSPAMLKEWGFSHVRLSPETGTQPVYASDIRALQDRGITVFASCADHQPLKWLTDSGVFAVCSPVNGPAVEEDELIRESLLRERE
ncbi:MAG: EAL domain-containing protein [Clostridia bacterium]|nr:EAL domain-containing protein [Clostridia bacterium]